MKNIFNKYVAALAAVAALAGLAQAQEQTQDFYDVLRANNIDARLVEGLKHKNMAVHILPADTNIYNNNSQTFAPEGPDGVCNIKVIHPSSTRREMIHQDATIPLKYVQDFDGPDYTFMRVLFHEATHCDMYDVDGSLAHEINGDIFAARALMSLPGGVEETSVLKHKRAVRAMLGEGVSHAMGLPLDALLKGQKLPDPATVETAHKKMYAMLYEEQILDPELHGYVYEPEGDKLRAVYSFMKQGLAAGRFESDPLVKRSAELYVEGINTLAPAMIAAHMAPKP